MCVRMRGASVRAVGCPRFFCGGQPAGAVLRREPGIIIMPNGHAGIVLCKGFVAASTGVGGTFGASGQWRGDVDG